MASKEANARVEAMFKHQQQVEAGVIPEDSPPDFVAPADGKGDNGLPWWFGPDYKPTDEALAADNGPPPSGSEGSQGTLID